MVVCETASDQPVEHASGRCRVWVVIVEADASARGLVDGSTPTYVPDLPLKP
jgi:hypothetical protein